MHLLAKLNQHVLMEEYVQRFQPDKELIEAAARHFAPNLGARQA